MLELLHFEKAVYIFEKFLFAKEILENDRYNYCVKN